MSGLTQHYQPFILTDLLVFLNPLNTASYLGVQGLMAFFGPARALDPILQVLS